MLKKELPDRVKVLIGFALALAVWGIGVLASGEFPTIVEFVKFSERCDFLCKIFPGILILFGIIIAAVCKRESKPAMLFGAYLFTAVPAVFFLILQLSLYTVPDYLIILFMAFLVLASPALSAFEGFFKAVYGNVRPVGFSEAHIAFCIAMVVVVVLPPIIYKLVKSK